MTEAKQPVIIGDGDAVRSEWLTQVLSDYYNVTALLADTFDKVRKMARESTPSVIFLADTLPFSYDDPEVTPRNNFIQLQAINPKTRLACIVTGDEYPDLSGVRAPVCYVRLPSSRLTAEEGDLIINALRPLSGSLPLANISIEEVKRRTSWRSQDRTLREQIHSLSSTHDWEDGKRHLFHLLRDCLDWRAVETVRLEPLTQGKSGALVLRLIVTLSEGNGKSSATKDYVLKLSKAKDIWKLESEVEGYLQASKSDLYSTYKAHVPALQMPWASRSSSEYGPRGETYSYIASSLSWDAIYYDFLGGPIGECMALDTAFISSPEKIQRRTAGNVKPKFTINSTNPSALRDFRLTFLETLLSALCEIWYFNDAFVSRKSKRLWKTEDAPDRAYMPLPPYQLTARTKRWVQEFLDSEEAVIGGRLFDEWDDYQARILKLLRGGQRMKNLGLLGEMPPVTLSPSHGDLNAGNAFLWLKQDGFPFLIDLPFYQSEGHILQDFARLEVELKFALMDKQEESPKDQLAAYDYSPEQVPLWRELEDNLLNDYTHRSGEPDWVSGGFRNNISLMYQAVKIIRDKAEQAQQQPCRGRAASPVPFMEEYLPALLYHTIRAITYPTLSLFKRLLAVYSSGAILKRLGV